ncbi:PiggyBac transposable element-derived protein 3 [Elysia marginata]|uniref:PiggyBac transposable element-derived protein 3 n=1 Tax=Elysia marginata TaxID=1093978 RepID=A0AAV4GKH6_9GAST|nr:PiggyBac transposable element-derived protein 3 [Elysia marginata]
MSGSVVVDFLSELPAQKFHVFTDNLFTSLALMSELRVLGMHGTGTTRAHCTAKCPLTLPQAIKQQPRGTMDCQLETTSNTVIVRWNDNKVVTVASTGYGVQPLQKAKRWSREKKQFITIPMPNAVAQYNVNMGGIDHMDQNLGAYRPTIRIKKWWWPIFRFAIGTAAKNA